VKLEAVGRIAVGDLGLEVCGQVDDVDGTEWALLGTDTTADTEALRDVSYLGLGSDFDAEFASSHNGAGFLAFLSTFLRFAFVAVDDGDSVVGSSVYAYFYSIRIHTLSICRP
jgi:hypothetical protein